MLPTLPERYHLLDAIRGFVILNVVVFHFLFDIYVLYEKNPAWTAAPAIDMWRQTVCWIFIFLSGFVWRWGRHSSWKRGLMLNLWGLLITLISWLLFPAHIIRFGILNFMGTAILLMIGLHKILDKIPPLIGMLSSVIAYSVCNSITRNLFSLNNIIDVPIPVWLYQWPIMAPLGFPPPNFTSADYFPLLPWIFIYFLGYFAHMPLTRNTAWTKIFMQQIPILSPLGTHTLLVYLIHQPLCLLLVSAIIPCLY